MFPVRKEILIAIVVGFALGMVITFGIWNANKALKSQQASQQPSLAITSEKEQSSPVDKTSLFLKIISPEDNLLSAQEKIQLAGEANSDATVVITYSEGEQVITPDGSGKFQTEITLMGGANEIIITAYDPDGNEIKKTINVVYSTATI